MSDFDYIALENEMVAAAGTALVKPALYWVGDEEGNISAEADTGLPNTIYVYQDTQTRESTIAYTDPTKNARQYTLDMPVRVLPCYDTVRNKRIDLQIIGADVKLASIRPPSDPSIGADGNPIAHTHQNEDEGGLLNAGAVFSAGVVETGYGGTAINLNATGGTGDALEAIEISPGVIDFRLKANNYTASAAPTASDDNTLKYRVGSFWYDTVADEMYQCRDDATGAAVWVNVSQGLLNNITATVNPDVTDDSTLGYSIGSLWYNTVNYSMYQAIGVTPSGANWKLTSSLYPPRATIITVTADYTLEEIDFTLLIDATAGNITVTLPTAVEFTGRYFNFKRIDASANTVTIDGDGGLIDTAATRALTTQYESIRLQMEYPDWWLI